MEKLADPANYRNDPSLSWQRIKAAGRNPAMLGRLKAIAAWRELEAQDKNIPRGRIARDETLADIASHPPKQQADLAKVRGLSSGWKDNDIGKRLMTTIAAAQPLGDDELPPRTPRGAPLGKEGALVADLLKLLLKIRSREIDVASRLLARSEELELLAAGVRKNLPILDTWRFAIFGKDALDLVEGKLAFAVVNGRLKMTHIDDVVDDAVDEEASGTEADHGAEPSDLPDAAE
jgi:ribonuclease D